MPTPDNPNLNQVILEFGAGLNTRTSDFKADPIECVEGQNFGLDIENSLMFRRKPFDLVATATNGNAINGFAQLKKVDGTLSTLIQAGSEVYEWDGGSTFTSRGTVRSGVKLRGPRTANFLFDDIALIADLNLVQPVMTWDGTTFQEMSHDLSGEFLARYVAVENERALYGNVKSGATTTEHVVVASAATDYNDLTTSDLPSSSLAVSAAWYLPMPNLRPINGMVPAFGTTAFSTQLGRIYQLDGTNAKDFAMSQLYDESGAAGRESMAFVGNDIAYGRHGMVESLFSSISLANVETDDLSREISTEIEDITGWTTVYDSRKQLVYFFPDGGNDVWVYHKSFVDERLRNVISRREAPKVSPWSRYKTAHASSFQTAAAWSMLRPTDGIEHVYFGGSGGQIYQFEGSGGQDAGSADIKCERLSTVFKAPIEGNLFDITGTILYRRLFATTATLNFEFGGTNVFDQAITVSLEAAENLPVYNNNLYYNSDVYYSAPFKKRLVRQELGSAGTGSHLQLRVTIDGATDFFIQQVEIDFASV